MKPSLLVPFSSPEGLARLERSGGLSHFSTLAQSYQAQINGTFCGVASLVMVLNARDAHRLQRLKRLQRWPQKSTGRAVFSQSTLLNSRTDKIKARGAITGEDPTVPRKAVGLTLGEVARLFALFKAPTRAVSADRTAAKGYERLRAELKESTQTGKTFIVLNFAYSTLGIKGSGHFSPVAAFDEMTDSALVMDVASHKILWYWAPIPLLYRAMHTRDGNAFRGYLVVKA